MNRQLVTLLVGITSCCLSVAQAEGPKIERLTQLANKVAHGQKLTETTLTNYGKSKIRILLYSEHDRIAIVQMRDGGCYAIFPSTLEGELYKENGIVVTNGFSASVAPSSPIKWKSAVIQNNAGSNDRTKIELKREDSNKTDIVFLRHMGDGPLTEWRFDLRPHGQ